MFGFLFSFSVVVKPAGGFCDICKMVVAYADKELEKNATTAEIEALLEKVCHFLPESVSEQVRCLCRRQSKKPWLGAVPVDLLGLHRS